MSWVEISLIACGVSTFTLLWVLAMLKAGARYDEAFERCQIDEAQLEGDLRRELADISFGRRGG